MSRSSRPAGPRAGASPAEAPPAWARSGVGAWLRSYVHMLRWAVLRSKYMIPFFAAVQILLSLSLVVGLGFIAGDLDTESATYLATGAPTMAVITIALVLAPEIVINDKLRGVFDYQRALPVPRLATLAAEATVWVVAALPGVALAFAAALVRFELPVAISPLLPAAVLLVALACVTIGFGLAYALPPEATNIVTQLVMFAALLFSPINFPAERLPEWLAALHTVLPFASMGQVVREAFVVPPQGIAPLPYLVLALWAVAGTAAAGYVVSRRS